MRRTPFQVAIATAGILAVSLTALAAPAEPAFPGFNGKIAFYTGRDGNSEVYSMNPDGSAQTDLSSNSLNDQDPAWSADGSKIAFVSNRDGNNEIYVMNADGTGQTRLTNNPEVDIAPTWSPDGTQIAFQTRRDGNMEIYKMNADGSSPVNLTSNLPLDAAPAWSPDGTKIAFYTTRNGNPEIYSMNADGSSPTRLTTNSTSDELPDWSPNGTQIVFDSNRDSGSNQQIYKMNADGTSQTRLTTNTAVDVGAVWSPDGTKIAFQTDRDLNIEVYVMNADGSGQTNVSNNSAADQSPDWQPAGVDSTLPETTIDFGPSGVTTNPTPIFIFSSNELGSTFQCSVDAGLFSFCTSPYTIIALAAGPHLFKVRAIDSAGNPDPSPASNSFYVFTQPPALPAPGGSTSPQPDPVVTNLKLRPSGFKAAGSGTTVSYVLSAVATVTFHAERATAGRQLGGKCKKAGKHAKGKRCTLYLPVKGSFKVAGVAGTNRFTFRGRISNRSVARGQYRLVAVPSAAGKNGAAVRALFTIG